MIRRVVRKLRALADAPRRAIERRSTALQATLRGASAITAPLLHDLIALPRWNKPIRVGIDVRPFYEPLTGVGWYLHHLLAELARDPRLELVAFGDSIDSEGAPHLHVALPDNVRLCRFDLRGHIVTRALRRAASAAFPFLVSLQRCDVFFAANYFLPRSLDAAARRRVITVHDLTFRRFPHLLQEETLEALEKRMAREVSLADAMICVSESTRRDLLHFYDVEPRRAVTVLSGLQPPAVAPGASVEGLPSRYILFVSTIEPRKNVTTLIDAFELLKERGAYDGKLVLVGKVGWKSNEVMERLATSRWRNEILRLDYLGPSQLATVYFRAEMFVFPSHYEGFGFPLLEAMAAGVPSIAADASSLPEVGGDAALYFDPARPDELAARIEQIASSDALKAELSAKGRAQSARFRWSDAAAQTAQVLIDAAQGHRR